MTGKLVGIGVGPGDPELITIKAVKNIKDSDIIVVPGENIENSTAYKIASSAVPELKSMKVVGAAMPMTKDQEVLSRSYRKIADRIEEWLKEGKKVGVLTLGDATVYSTYLYIHKLVKEDGFETEIINGVPSFCAVAAKLNIGLGERSDEIHILPASYQIEDGLKLSGTKILMKAGRQIKKVKEQIKAADMDAVMIENCGMEDEKIYRNVDSIDENAGYYSLMIVK